MKNVPMPKYFFGPLDFGIHLGLELWHLTLFDLIRLSLMPFLNAAKFFPFQEREEF